MVDVAMVPHFRASEQSTQQAIEVEQLVRLWGRSGA
jgi:hypothetical protein